MTVESEKLWVYCFNAWPDEQRGFPKSIFDWFRAKSGMVEMELTEAEFSKFHSELHQHGITLREISRRPWVEEEIVPYLF